MGYIGIKDIMKASIGEANSEIKASFKKTVLVRQYETEVVEIDTKVTLDRPVTNGERMFISALLYVQLEYTAYTQLLFKGLVTSTELAEREKALTDEINALKNKIEDCGGKNMDYLLSFAHL